MFVKQKEIKPKKSNFSVYWVLVGHFLEKFRLYSISASFSFCTKRTLLPINQMNLTPIGVPRVATAISLLLVRSASAVNIHQNSPIVSNKIKEWKQKRQSKNLSWRNKNRKKLVPLGEVFFLKMFILEIILETLKISDQIRKMGLFFWERIVLRVWRVRKRPPVPKAKC